MKFSFAAPQITTSFPSLTSNLESESLCTSWDRSTGKLQSTIEHVTARVSSHHQNFLAPHTHTHTHFGNHCLIRQLANLILPLTKPRSPRQRLDGLEEAIELLPAPTSCGDNRRMKSSLSRSGNLLILSTIAHDFEASFKGPNVGGFVPSSRGNGLLRVRRAASNLFTVELSPVDEYHGWHGCRETTS